jgi:hypothetical protein
MSEERVGPVALDALVHLYGDQTLTERLLALDLMDARIENAQICEKLAAAQRGEDIPGLVKRIAEAERELALARPVVEAATNALIAYFAVGDDRLELDAMHKLQEAVAAAREEGEKP